MSNPLRLLVLRSVSAFVFGSSLSHGTSIAFVRTDQEIVIAADSRATDANGNKKPDVCKIRKAGQLYFTMVGQIAWQNVDFEGIAARSIRSSGTLDSRVTSLVREMMPLLDHVLESDPPARNIALKQGSIMSIIVYGQDSGRLVGYLVKFEISEGNQHVRPIRLVCPGGCIDGRLPVLTPSGVLDTNIPSVRAARKFVQTEIDRHTPDIGGPIQIMRIDRNGVPHWIEQPDVCKDQ